jgi:hypothetical protein
MLRKALAIDGHAIAASDGRIGTVNDILFDHASWLVRWLVVDAGKWNSGRKVLLSPSVWGQLVPTSSNRSILLRNRASRLAPTAALVSGRQKRLLWLREQGNPRQRRAARAAAHAPAKKPMIVWSCQGVSQSGWTASFRFVHEAKWNLAHQIRRSPAKVPAVPWMLQECEDPTC